MKTIKQVGVTQDVSNTNLIESTINGLLSTPGIYPEKIVGKTSQSDIQQRDYIKPSTRRQVMGFDAKIISKALLYEPTPEKGIN